MTQGLDWRPCPDAPCYDISSKGDVKRVVGGPGAVQSAHISKVVRGLKWRQQLQPRPA